MFTGIIHKTTTVVSSKKKDDAYIVQFKKPAGWKLSRGQSISVDGICSTVIATDAKTFAVDYMPETLKKTTAEDFTEGVLVNLETSMTLKTFIDGHVVQGHVDATAEVIKIVNNGSQTRNILFSVPKSLVPYIATHGSICINGVSLTVAHTKGTEVMAALIPYTLSHTNVGTLKKGDRVNLEVDLLARYLHKMLSK